MHRRIGRDVCEHHAIRIKDDEGRTITLYLQIEECMGDVWEKEDLFLTRVISWLKEIEMVVCACKVGKDEH